MKTSISKLFSTLQINILILLIIFLFSGLIILSASATQQRIENIKQQEQMVRSALLLSHDDLSLSKIRSDEIRDRLPILIEKMYDTAFYELIYAFPFVNEIQIEHIKKDLYEQAKAFSTALKDYIDAPKTSVESQITLENRVNQYLLALYPAVLQQSKIQSYYLFAASAVVILSIIWTLGLLLISRRTSRAIMSDVNTLFQLINGKRVEKTFFTTDLNRVASMLRGGFEHILQTSNTDDVTQLLNFDGLKSAVENQKLPSANQKIYICVFEIDNFSKLTNHYPQNVIDPILIKIASILKLYKRNSDQMGFISKSMFVAVFNRKDKKSALDDCNHIRLAVEESSFKIPHESFSITLSGGFTAKADMQSFDQAVSEAKVYLNHAAEKGGNRLEENTYFKNIL